jgi:hypothetical protein
MLMRKIEYKYFKNSVAHMSLDFASRARQLSFCALLVASASHAATVELRLLDELDQPIADVEVNLTLDRGSFSHFYPGHRGVTDPSGRVVLEGISAGRYLTFLVAEEDRFVELEGHPSIRTPSITVEDDQDTVNSTLRFVRGAPVVFRVSARGAPLPWPRLVLRDLDRGWQTEILIRDGLIEHDMRLVPGRWTAQVQPIPGYLLTSVEINRTELPGYIAEVDLPPGEQPWYINFEYAAPAVVWGYVRYEGERFGVEIVAQLEEAGPWLPSVQARGGSIYKYASARPQDPKRDYEMVVPDGRWIVSPRGEQLEGAEPNQVEIQLAPGDERRIDFVVRGSATDGEEATRVAVRKPEGGRVLDTPVEVWDADPENRPASPLAQERTTYFGIADIRGLDADTPYLFVAGAEGFVEETVTMKPPAPDDDPDMVLIHLKRGATVHAVSRNDDDAPLASIEVSLTRQDETSSMMTAPEIIEWARRPVGKTDDTGHLWLRGVYPGRYLVEGTLLGDDAARYFVEFRDSSSEDWESSIERTYVGEDIDEFDLRLTPAAGVQAIVQCSDGAPVPEEADILVLQGTSSYEDTVESDWIAEAVHASGDFVLEGDNRDRITAGPLVGGAYHVLVRPAGHNRWTWALGTEFPEDAAVIATAPGDPTDLGTIAVDCAPAIAIRPTPPEDVELPDLAETNVDERVGEISGTVTLGDRRRRVPHARTVTTSTEVQFRDLPEGKASLEAVVYSPFFLPHPELPVTIDAILERGTTLTIDHPVAGIGGALDVVPGGWTKKVLAVRLIRHTDEPGEESEITISAPAGSSFLIPSLFPGRYRVTLCIDAVCEAPPVASGVVDVRAGEISVFEAP